MSDSETDTKEIVHLRPAKRAKIEWKFEPKGASVNSKFYVQYLSGIKPMGCGSALNETESDEDGFESDSSESASAPPPQLATALNGTVKQVESLVQKIRNKPKYLDKLKELQVAAGKEPLSLTMHVQTRWNSTFDMLLRFKELKVFITVLFDEEVSEINWSALDKR